ncbi:HpcH/HpaI aldolase/citrate lyase family protein [Ideonella livida]|uniref:CoA ester lyase n=1 Tax=Ideonella livida TaxID=2707176 RepID=A0A7C9TM40_9BURK|nr:aldolase/citrate lyase family protein [Ideonella livida]NDY92047.1 CoA ester lyase [Ideonella livida]
MTFSAPERAARLGAARSLLFVPGHRPERFAKAAASGADALVLDLEDAVAPAEKPAARAAVQAAWPGLAALGLPVVLRLNARGSAAGVDDATWLSAWCQGAQAPVGLALMVAKAETPADLQAAQAAAGSGRVPVVPLVESAAGWAGLAALSVHPGVLRLALGHIDFLADTGLAPGPDERELDPLRFAMALHTRLAGLAPAVDGVTTALDDAQALTADAHRALRFGFGGKLCIHPRQIAPLHAALAPTEAERAWALRVVAADQAAGGAAVQLDGRMVDRPVVLRAQRLLAR